MKIGVYDRTAQGESQIEKYEDYIKGKWGDAHKIIYYIDENISGFTNFGERQFGKRLLDDIRNRKIDFIVMRNADRISRSLATQYVILEELEQEGIDIYFIEMEQNAGSPETQLFYAVYKTIREYEAEKSKRKQKKEA